MKPVITVRKNAIFFRSPKGASASAVILSLVQTAKVNGFASIVYLQKVLTTALQHVNEAGEVTISQEELERIMLWNIK